MLRSNANKVLNKLHLLILKYCSVSQGDTVTCCKTLGTLAEEEMIPSNELPSIMRPSNGRPMVDDHICLMRALWISECEIQAICNPNRLNLIIR